MVLVFEGREMGLARERQHLAFLAWHMTNLSRTKRLPELGKFIQRAAPLPRRGPRRRQTSAQQWAIFGCIAEAAKAIAGNHHG